MESLIGNIIIGIRMTGAAAGGPRRSLLPAMEAYWWSSPAAGSRRWPRLAARYSCCFLLRKTREDERG
ncbi:hypothetical protein H5410_026391 [Solanum commersonii]|uniref:Uncharacterized protein n=1 Tax=Solanum commersonii TaxID=4109 RepID=A0A9J5YVZ5_SOLCO|nr:hypothetical protein H5410_026391 [Solanum commersonii]